MINDQLPDMSHLPEQDQRAVLDSAEYLRKKAETRLRVGMRVRILIPVSHNTTQEGIIYDYLPSRRWPWRVRPDGEFWEDEGIAFKEGELESIKEGEEVK